MTEEPDLVERLRDGCGIPRITEMMDEAADEIERLKRNQITASHTAIAQAAAMHAQEADAQARRASELEHKCEQFTAAILRAMTLIDELVRENGRLCAASDAPPPITLFAAKTSFDAAMKALLGDEK